MIHDDVEIDEPEGMWRIWVDRDPSGAFRRLCIGQSPPEAAEVLFESENIDVVQRQKWAIEWRIANGQQDLGNDEDQAPVATTGTTGR